MKRSNKILIIVAVFAAVVLIVGIVGMRLYLDKVIEEGGRKFSREAITGSDTLVEREKVQGTAVTR
ncbi:MAG: hypothetical protein ACLFNZ_02655 [Spirochaetaceae bacterium]